MHYRRRFWRESRCEANFDLVVFAMSLGGMEVFGQILRALPADFPAPIAAVQHLSPLFPSQLVELLQRSCALRLRWASQDAPLESGSVYLAPPDHHFAVSASRRCAVFHGPKVSFTRPAANVLFESGAARCRTVGVVLTGGGTDGAAGARAIRSRGGIVIVQDPATAVDASMPRTAIREGSAAFVLPPAKIAHALVSLVAVPGAVDLFGASRAA